MKERSPVVALVTTTLLLLGATSLFAQPVITGISPTEGPTSGGTVVTITGRGFAHCKGCSETMPPWVAFGDFPARSVIRVDSSTLKVVTPAQTARSVYVMLGQFNGGANAPSFFTYTGADSDAMQRYLLPIFVPPVPGAYGSEFRSELRLWNPTPWLARVSGLWTAPVCAACSNNDFADVDPGAALRPDTALHPGRPGKFIEVTNDAAELLAANLRVYDTSRSSTNFGTEIPVVSVSAFRKTIALTGIPNDPRFRLMLRVYGSAPTPAELVSVTFAGESRTLHMRNGADRFDPSYAELNLSIPAGVTAPRLDLRLDSSSAAGDMPATPIWAFVTVTNNETQHITTITPQPSR